MKTSLATILMFVAVLLVSGCSSSTNASSDSGSSSATSDSSATSSSDTSAAAASAAPGDALVYPGATPAEKSSYGTPPPGGKLYVTTDDPVKVGKWYETNGAKASAPTTAKGGMLLVGDQSTGTFVTLIGEGGKTYIQILPVSAAK